MARADDRGLGHMTWEFYRHLHPDRTLVVREPGAERLGFAPHLERYPDSTTVTLRDRQLPAGPVREFLAGLDVVYSAETVYDERLPTWADRAGVRTVLHVMPEFFGKAQPGVDLWAPTPWRLDDLGHPTVVPVPVADDRFPMRPPTPTGQLRLIHVAGHRAALDRNGTLQLLQAMKFITEPVELVVFTQDSRLPRHRGRGTVRYVTGGVADYWELYRDADVLVMPRRYGGLCLPVQEAMAAGLAVVMSDCSPNDWWPTIRVEAKRTAPLVTAAGAVPTFAASPLHLARTIDALAADRHLVQSAQAASVRWAEANCWTVLADRYRTELAS